jgi:hypothetical protein
MVIDSFVGKGELQQPTGRNADALRNERLSGDNLGRRLQS